MVKEKNTRQVILEAALEIAGSNGIKELTQTNVAAAAGVRQSHLTYYFPLKVDLLTAVLEASHRDHYAKTGKKSKQDANLLGPDRAIKLVEEIFLDRNKMIFFLGVLAESINEKDLKDALKSHMDGFRNEVALLFGKDQEDASVQSFLDHMRGICLVKLLENNKSKSLDVDVRKVAKLHKMI